MLWVLSNMVGMVTTDQVPAQKSPSASNFSVLSYLDATTPAVSFKHTAPKAFSLSAKPSD